MIHPASMAPAKAQAATTSCGVPAFGGDTAFFFVLVAGYVWWAVDPRLIHHSIGILTYYHPFSFQTGWGFFAAHLGRPGGLVEYAARFLTGCYAFAWGGTLLIAGAAWYACWCIDGLGRLAGRPRGRVFRYVPAVILVALCGSYSHPLRTLLSLLAALSSFFAYARWVPPGLGQRVSVLVLACGLLYHAAGAGSLLFPLLVGLYELSLGWHGADRVRQVTRAAAAVGLGAAIPGAAALLFSLDVRVAYGGFLVSDPGLLPDKWPAILALYICFPGFFAGALLGRAAASRRQAARGRRTPAGARPDGQSAMAHSALRVRAQAALWMAAVVLGGGAAAWFSRDTLTRSVLQTDYHAQRAQWRAALAAARAMPPGTYNVRCHRNVMLALYHAGRLGDELFHYPQRPGVDLFSTPAEVRDLGSDFQESRLFLALGQVNQAEKCACEALETCGDLPAVLEELALINVIKGRPETARIFLQALARNPFHRRTAHALRERLDADPGLDDDPQVTAARRNMVGQDEVALDTTVEEFLQALLETNPRNQMAFEFLLAHYLGTGRPDKAVPRLARLKDFSFRAVPRHYQEAVAVYAAATGKPPSVPGYELEAAVFTRADAFARIMSGARSREAAAEAALAAGFGDSYFFYFAFSASRP